MTILSGERYIVETLSQFFDRTTFTEYDALALEEERIVSEYNQMDESLDDIENVSEIHEDETSLWMDYVDDPIVRLLEEDNRNWVHLYDGIVHTIVEVYDK